MTGIEFMVSEVMEPHLFVMRKQKRDSPERVTPMLTYYVLDGSIYQAPQLCNVFAARVVCDCSLFCISFLYMVPLKFWIWEKLNTPASLSKLTIYYRNMLRHVKWWSVCCFVLIWLWIQQGRALYHISKAFTTAASKLEKVGYGKLYIPSLRHPFIRFNVCPIHGLQHWQGRRVR